MTELLLLFHKAKRRLLPLIGSLSKPKWFIMFCLGRIHFIRSFVGLIQQNSNQPNQLLLLEEQSVFENLNVAEVILQLKNKGLYSGIHLPKDLLEEILEFTKSARYIANGNLKYTFSLINKEQEELKAGQVFVSGHHYSPGDLCPAVQKIENDPKLLKIAASYLGTKPILIGSQIRWNFVTPEKLIPEPQRGFFRFHYDLEDYYFIKFFFYLNDVDLDNSPHVVRIQG
ncbi:MAG: hypothetical protein GVY04_09185 [Cyanobacteria bacterium]|nr:hypothetical protein [Cyanobacteria bacterium GSL.Bin1]